MRALTLFNQNFAVAESLLQLHQMFSGMRASKIDDDLRFAICRLWREPPHSAVQHASNDRVTLLARSTTTIPASLTLPGGLDFLLLILKNFERGTLSNADAIDRITRILTIRNFWELVEGCCGEPVSNLRRHVTELIWRRNQIAHRADRPDDGEPADAHGLRPVTLSWTNLRVHAAKTLVTAGAEIIEETVARLEADIRAAREQEEARRLAARGRTS